MKVALKATAEPLAGLMPMPDAAKAAHDGMDTNSHKTVEIHKQDPHVLLLFLTGWLTLAIGGGVLIR
jgi:hypothetical protein